MRLDLSPRNSSKVHGLFGPAKVPFLEWWAARHLATRLPRLAIPFRPKNARDPASPSTARVSKRGGHIVEVGVDLAYMRTQLGFSAFKRRFGVFVRLLSDRTVPDGDWWIDVDDSVRNEGPYLGFCSRWNETILVPDRGFCVKRGYERERRAGRAAPAYEDRDPAIVWRGSPTGLGDLLADPLLASSTSLRQRVRLCLLLRDRPPFGPDAVDVRIARGRALEADVADRYEAAGILGDFIPAHTWCKRRFAIDVDGYANAFSNFLIRLLYGCCVIRVASPRGFRQWYHDRLEAGRHYVPVAADLSDLDAVIDWCRRNPRECGVIAREGQRVAREMTYAHEMEVTVDAIRRHGPVKAAHPARSHAARMGEEST